MQQMKAFGIGQGPYARQIEELTVGLGLLATCRRRGQSGAQEPYWAGLVYIRVCQMWERTLETSAVTHHYADEATKAPGQGVMGTVGPGRGLAQGHTAGTFSYTFLSPKYFISVWHHTVPVSLNCTPA